MPGTTSQCSHIIMLLSPGLSNFKVDSSEQRTMITNENSETMKQKCERDWFKAITHLWRDIYFIEVIKPNI